MLNGERRIQRRFSLASSVLLQITDSRIGPGLALFYQNNFRYDVTMTKPSKRNLLRKTESDWTCFVLSNY